MGNWYGEFDSTPTNIVADIKTRILNSSNWSNISGGTGNVLQATTSDGAQMNIDLADAAATARQIQVAFYRTYASSTGTDKLTRYMCWHTTSSGATSDALHVVVSAGQDHLYISIEGPRAGETNPDDTSGGSARQCCFVGRIVPYFSAEPSGIVLALGNISSLSPQASDTVYVSRNRANTASWVTAKLATLTVPSGPSTVTTPWFSQQRFAQADSNTYLWPYVVVEDVAGIRGRLGKVFFSGWFNPPSPTSNDYPPSLYQRLVYNSENYVLVAPHKGASPNPNRSAFGWLSQLSGSNLTCSPAVAVPTQ